MSGTWPTARAALVTQIDGLALTVSGHSAETLHAYAYAPPTRQDASNYPIAYVLPVRATVARHPGAERETIIEEVRVRVLLSGPGATNMESLHQRYDGWWQALRDAVDDAVAMDGGLDVWGAQEFEGLAQFNDIDVGWGFEMVLRDARFTEVATFTP